MRPTMGSVGGTYDNATCECFFATLECKLLAWRRFASQAEADIACFSCIGDFYNLVRLHSALAYRSPMAYEVQMQATTTETYSPKPICRPRKQGDPNLSRTRSAGDDLSSSEPLFGPLVTLAVYVALTAVVLVPVLAVEVPCLGDYLNHLARIHVLTTIGSSPALQRFYENHWLLVPISAWICRWRRWRG